MKYVVIGLGNYGSDLAERLTVLGNEVIGVDIDEHRVDIVKDKIAATFIIDATDEVALSVLPLNTIDLVIVAIGEDFGASVRVVALLKKKKVKRIYARAIDDIHQAILEAFNIDKILNPEGDAANDLAQLLDFGTEVEAFKIDNEYYVMKFKLPERFIGYRFNDLNFNEEFGIKMIALKRGHLTKNFLGVDVLDTNVVENVLPGDYVVEANDELVCYGHYKNFSSLLKS